MDKENLGYWIIYNLMFLGLAILGAIIFIHHGQLYDIVQNYWLNLIILGMGAFLFLKMWHFIERKSDWLYWEDEEDMVEIVEAHDKLAETFYDHEHIIEEE